MENLYISHALSEHFFFLPGSFFPPREYTKSDIVHVYDKDLCRILPLQYRGDVVKYGVTAGYYTPSDDAFETAEKNKDNQCYCPGVGNYCPPKGLQNINPCHFGRYFIKYVAGHIKGGYFTFGLFSL